MSDIIQALQACHLFKDIPEAAIQDFIKEFPYQVQEYGQGACIISKDDTPGYIGIVLSGTLGIYSDSLHGGHTLIGIADENYLFGFIARFYNNARSITALYARNRCKIVKFMIPAYMASHEFIAKTDTRIISNMFAILTAHIERDFDRMYLISTYSVRIKLVRYLLYERTKNNSLTFQCPFNKTELASYLGVYRTSLIHEIRKMDNEEIIAADKNQFTILDIEQLIEIEQMSYER